LKNGKKNKHKFRKYELTSNNCGHYFSMKLFRSVFPKQINLIIGLLVLFGPSVKPGIIGYQLASGNWSEPVNLSNSDGESNFPSITSDPSGVVHLVWNEEIASGENVIQYSRLENTFWTEPTDIMVDARGATSIASDDQGYLHMAWLGTGGIYYSKAFAPFAKSARAWSTPQLLYPGYNFLGAFDLAVGEGDSAGTVCMSNAQQIGQNSGIFVACSFNRGDSWGEPHPAYENLSPSRLVDQPRLAIDQDGTIHIVWVESKYPETFPPLGIKYTNSNDQGETWTEVQSLADGPYSDPEIAIRDKREIHVVWSGTDVDRYKFHRWSKDDGRTWLETRRNTDLGGLQGYPALVTDSNKVLHWLTVGTIFDKNRLAPDVNPDSLYYASFQNGVWSPGKVLLSSSVAKQNMTNVSAAVALGNQLHVAVMSPLGTQGGGYQFDIIYMQRTLDSTALAVQPLSEPVLNGQTPVATTAESTTSVPTQFAKPALHTSISSEAISQKPWIPIAISVIPILLLFAAVILTRTLRKR
jgi:hypothetical protein